MIGGVFSKIRFAVETNPGNVRSNNEDNYYIKGDFREDTDEGEIFFEGVSHGSGRFLAAVFDGMGGMEHAERASYLSAAVMDHYCERHIKKPDFDSKRLIHHMNKRVVKENEASRGRMGSTVVFLTFENGIATSYNVGDSRSYLMRDGILRQISEDHTEQAQMKKIAAARGLSYDPARGRGHVLTQCLGVPQEEFIIEPYVSDEIILEKGDVFLLCSDGLHNMLTDEQIAFIIGHDMPLRDRRRQLIRKTMAAGGRDNVTVILIEVVR